MNKYVEFSKTGSHRKLLNIETILSIFCLFFHLRSWLGHPVSVWILHLMTCEMQAVQFWNSLILRKFFIIQLPDINNGL